MQRLINSSRWGFLVLTALVSFVALIASVTDVQSTTRLVWIVLAISCWGVISTWKVEKA